MQGSCSARKVLNWLHCELLKSGGKGMKLKKVLVVFMTTAMTVGMLAGCGDGKETAVNEQTEAQQAEVKSEETTQTTDAIENSDLSGVQISFLNTKGEVQTALEEMAEVFKEETGIEVEILACGTGESPYTKVTSAYNSGTAPTMAMLDNTDIVSLAEEYAVDLSAESWVADCEGQTMSVNGTI